jgi:RNA polymerase sigma factor (sigma-70 family)
MAMREEAQSVEAVPLSLADRQRLFTEFYEAHYEISYRFLRAQRFPNNHIQDLLHHCFELAWHRFDEYLDAGRPRYWFLGILKNRRRYESYQMAAAPISSPELASQSEDIRSGPEESLLQKEERSYFYNVIRGLPEHYAAVVKLRIEGFGFSTIAEQLGITVKSAEHRMRRAIFKLEKPIREFARDYLNQGERQPPSNE